MEKNKKLAYYSLMLYNYATVKRKKERSHLRHFTLAVEESRIN